MSRQHPPPLRQGSLAGRDPTCGQRPPEADQHRAPTSIPPVWAKGECAMTNEPFTAPAHASGQPLTTRSARGPRVKTPTSRRLR
jgi:hypothetical protein